MERVISDTRHPIKIWATDLEAEAEKQLRNVASLPFVFKHLAAMPDAHAGKGSTVGTVLATKGAIIPACVGVDIGCGMGALKLPFKIDVFKDLPKLRHSIERAIPTGMNANKTISDRVGNAFNALGQLSDVANSKMRKGVLDKAIHSIGSLGGGNHFIEICGDENNDAWIMLHSGSRNIGKCLAEIHIDKAKDLMREYFLLGEGGFDVLPDADLAFLVQGTPSFDAYIHDLLWGQAFAKANREEMMDRALREVLWHVNRLPEYNDMKTQCFRVNCHHNFTQLEHHFGQNVWITRKGAVSAKESEWGIIPGAMSTGSFIIQGKGNAESFNSCSHGSGRRMSRTEARKRYTREDLIASLKGIEARTDASLIDEIEHAYKDLNVVMKNQEDLVTPVYRLKQIINIKGD